MRIEKLFSDYTPLNQRGNEKMKKLHGFILKDLAKKVKETKENDKLRKEQMQKELKWED